MREDAVMYVMARDQVTREQLRPIAYHMLRQWRVHLRTRRSLSSGKLETMLPLDFARNQPLTTGTSDPIAELMQRIPKRYRNPEAVWLRVSILGLAYDEYCRYGEGSEHVAIAGWLECAFPGGKVFYGQRDGDQLVLFDQKRREKVLADFLVSNKLQRGTGPDCSLCKFPMHDYHFGEEQGAGEAAVLPEHRLGTYYCQGCRDGLNFPGDILNRSPKGFRDCIIDVLPWAALNHEELLNVIFETPLHYWSEVSKQDFARWLSHPRQEVRQAAIRLMKG